MVFGVCSRNAECWLAKAADHLSNALGCPLIELTSDDPSPVVKKAFGLVGFDKAQKESGVAAYVKTAPLKQWLRDKSFESFYEQLWNQSKQHGCALENLR